MPFMEKKNKVKVDVFLLSGSVLNLQFGMFVHGDVICQNYLISDFNFQNNKNDYFNKISKND